MLERRFLLGQGRLRVLHGLLVLLHLGVKVILVSFQLDDQLLNGGQLLTEGL